MPTSQMPRSQARDQGPVGHRGEYQSSGTDFCYLLTTDLAGLLRLPLLGPGPHHPIPNNDVARPLDAKACKSSLEASPVECLKARARKGTLLLELESCLWLGPLSHRLIEVTRRILANLPAMLLLVYRPLDVMRIRALRVRQLPHFAEFDRSEFAA